MKPTFMPAIVETLRACAREYRTAAGDKADVHFPLMLELAADEIEWRRAESKETGLP